MPISTMKFVRIRAPASADYKLICFKFGGKSEFFAGEGYSSYDYFSGILVDSQPSLLVSDTYGSADEAVHKAGKGYAADLAAGWKFIKKNWDKLPIKSLLTVERSAGNWLVTKAEDMTLKEVI